MHKAGWPPVAIAPSLTDEVGIVPKFFAGIFSAGETAAVEKGLLLRCGAAAEDGIAMREPSEPPDDVGVNFRPFQIFRIARGLVEGNAALLVGEIL